MILFANGLSAVIKISVYILFCQVEIKEFLFYIYRQFGYYQGVMVGIYLLNELKDDINDDDNRKDCLFVDDYDVIIYLLNELKGYLK